ncbi:MAG: mannose-1-phosphate guanylyltransferase [Candidatus Eisenbacteria sp.]|nr:mannose-1-phosphate guanylyltransferase [Candidatus Eisenbacteria bacterium]
MTSEMFAVIMAGGRGTRFWPLSRRNRAKQFLRIAPGGTLIQSTVARIQPLLPADRILVVLGEDQLDEAARQLPGLPPENFVVEPVGRNTAPAIALASMVVSDRDPDGVMVVLPADHLIGDEADFRGVLAAAGEAACKSSVLVVLGIRPTGPDTGFGYIEVGEMWAEESGRSIHRVGRFVEKPTRERAEKYVEEGFLWNSGMFVWRASIIRDQIAMHLPELQSTLDGIWNTAPGSGRSEKIREVYPELDAVSIDYGVMEKSADTVVIPCQFGWNDVGSWSALASVWKKDEQGNAVRGQVVTMGAKRCVVSTDDRLVALVDVEDVIVVDTPDAILVCRSTSDQKLRDLVNLLQVSSLDRYL